MDCDNSNKRFTSIRKLTDNRFLNLYEMDARMQDGTPFQYYFASRNARERLPLLTGKVVQSGIVVYPIWRDFPEKIILIRQYRYPLDRWIYELPAGLIDEGETAFEAAVREMKEETGLEFTPYEGGSAAYRRPVFLGAGMTDETSTSVFGYAYGEISDRFKENTESIEVVLADKNEVRRILSEEQVSLRGALLLMEFLQMKKESPFSFLDT